VKRGPPGLLKKKAAEASAMRFKGKVAAVTGAGRGIGRQIALEFAREGAALAVAATREGTIMPAADEMRALGAHVLPLVADVSKEEDVEKFVAAAYEKFGRVDILVNNAGMSRDNLFLRMKAADFDEVVAVNLRGTFLCMRHFSRRMMKDRAGRIINMSSVAGEAGNEGQANYAAAKAGVIALTKSAARELARYGITVNALSPGLIDTDMLSGIEAPVMETLKKNIPLGRLGSASDVAAAALFLASDDASYITGQTIRIDGGLYI